MHAHSDLTKNIDITKFTSGCLVTAMEISDHTDKLDEHINGINESITLIINNVSRMVVANNYLEQELFKNNELLNTISNNDIHLTKENINEIVNTVLELSSAKDLSSSFSNVKKELSTCLYDLRESVKVLEYRRDMFDLMCPDSFIENFPDKGFVVPKKMDNGVRNIKFSDIIYNISVIMLSVGSENFNVSVPCIFQELEREHDKDNLHFFNLKI